MAKKSNNPLGIVLAALLLVAFVLKGIDLRARGRAKQTFEVVSKLLAGDTITNQVKIHELLGEPSKGLSSADKTWTDIYSYRGVFKRFAVHVEYSDRAEKLVEGVSME